MQFPGTVEKPRRQPRIDPARWLANWQQQQQQQPARQLRTRAAKAKAKLAPPARASGE
jgi:hypothetical protein